MRSSTLLALLLAATLPSGAFGQTGGLGLDLTDETKKEEPKKEEKPLAPELDLTPPAPRSAPAEARLSEMEITSEDRVKSVQRKAFIKRTRFELTPMTFLTLNDAFFPKYGPGARVAFYPNDAFGLAVRGFQYNLIPTNTRRLASRALHSRLPYVLPKESLSLDLMWSPIYGKAALFNSIRTFDIYLMGGAGALWSQTSNTEGVHLTTSLGIGERFSVLDFMAIDISAIETLYSDMPGSSTVIQHVLSVNAGLSFFLPFSFEYKEP
jgi:outer membrane beta-barrel protein